MLLYLLQGHGLRRVSRFSSLISRDDDGIAHWSLSDVLDPVLDRAVDLDGFSCFEDVRSLSDDHLALTAQDVEDFLTIVAVRRMGTCSRIDFGHVKVQPVVIGAF